MTTKTINVSQAEGSVLDWLVAKCEGYECQFDDEVSGPWLVPQEGYLHNETPLSAFTPSTAWSQGGPIIEREGISVMRVFKDWPHPWCADHDESYFVNAPTPLIAAMRCFCVSKLGETVEAPEELI